MTNRTGTAEGSSWGAARGGISRLVALLLRSSEPVENACIGFLLFLVIPAVFFAGRRLDTGRVYIPAGNASPGASPFSARS